MHHVGRARCDAPQHAADVTPRLARPVEDAARAAKVMDSQRGAVSTVSIARSLRLRPTSGATASRCRCRRAEAMGRRAAPASGARACSSRATRPACRDGPAMRRRAPVPWTRGRRARSRPRSPSPPAVPTREPDRRRACTPCRRRATPGSRLACGACACIRNSLAAYARCAFAASSARDRPDWCQTTESETYRQ